MTRFLFWNVCGVASPEERSSGKLRPLQPSDSRYRRLRRIILILAKRHNIDVIILCESPFEGALGLTGFTEAPTSLPPNRHTRTRLELYHRDAVTFTGFEAIDRAVIHEMTTTAGSTILLVTAHLYSPLNISEKMRALNVKTLASDIRDAEARRQHTRTVLVGDLNYDPYDDPIREPEGLNAVASKSVARQGERKNKRLSYPFFYNPMWAHLSDVAGGELAGSYHQRNGDLYNRFWHMPDQVLVRPSLLDCWDDGDLHILPAAGKIALLDANGHPDRERFSDHLALIFALDI